MPSTFLVTASDEFQGAAWNELRHADPQLRMGDRLAPGLFLITSCLPEAAFTGAVQQQQPIYARHLFPVQATLPLTRSIADLDQLTGAVSDLLVSDLVGSDLVVSDLGASRLPAHTQLHSQTTFSVQARLVARETNPSLQYAYTSFAIKERLAAIVQHITGASENVSNPQVVVSVVCTAEHAYLGISTAQANLSSWAGGMRRLAKRPEQISRAELKLQEAIDVFRLTLPPQGRAIDLGAAPGGWTRLLLAAGLQVTAVDPAALDASLTGALYLTHYRGYAQRFLETALANPTLVGSFDVLVSDLRMDAILAARLLSDYAPLLAEDGFVITTLKLPHASPRLKPDILAKQALHILSKTYAIVWARQLFHNRQEITVLLRQPIL